MSGYEHGKSTRISLTDIDIGGAIRKSETTQDVDVAPAEYRRHIGGSFGIAKVPCLSPMLLKIAFGIGTAILVVLLLLSTANVFEVLTHGGGFLPAVFGILAFFGIVFAWCLLRIGYELALVLLTSQGLLREIRDYTAAGHDIQIATRESVSTLCSLQRATRDHISHFSRVVDEAHAEEETGDEG